ncbi:Coproporphyrinogen-III oxidase [Coemansia sp. RSA 1722]|nr:Coproporphyrinogen-III oxidase [Coemansia sp. RSA 486]KAJ2222290.1 Coproporphyrinogen-III oxidase [Coemansia sp. RSA 485]KAJ2598886.1 Coproporphyrinogen-III oxidase [Coemansia sp. RSA 1722]KAJ2638263.1 Coproporphyrinogen-III oxidase [Coemansia sp. RSA 1286]
MTASQKSSAGSAASGYSLVSCIGAAAVTGAAGLYMGTRVNRDDDKQATNGLPGSKLGSEVGILKAPAVIPYTDYENEPKPAYYSDTSRPMHERMEDFVLDLQDRLVTALESLEPSKKFFRDRWEREDGKGYGISCVMQDGQVFEKAGVNVSVIEGTLTAGQLKSMRDRNPQTAKKLEAGVEYDFRVAGVSVVVHPRNPYAPTAHKNYRRFEVYKKNDKKAGPVMAWFGGGADLTPAYLFEDDVQYFHQTLKHACDTHDPAYYPRFKAWCDEYFTNVHRGETRGLGGIFFDDLEDKAPEELFHFAYDSGNSFIRAYVPIVARRMAMPYSLRERNWQLIRRGHYAEFNLVYDRGTKFGLMTPGARIESILMSLPLTARWEYMNKPEPGSPEKKLLDAVRTTTEWAK